MAIETASAQGAAERARQAADWLAGYVAGYRGHPLHAPHGCNVHCWLSGWLDGSELRRARNAAAVWWPSAEP